MAAERAGFLPAPAEAGAARTTLAFGGPGRRIEVAAPALDPAQIEGLARRLKDARRRRLAALPVEAVVAAIDGAAARLLDRGHPLRRKAEDLLPAVTGFDPETVRLGLTASLETYRAPQLRRFLAGDFANPAILDSFQPTPAGGFSRAFGPDLCAHIWAGNVPGLPLWSLVSALLVKSASIGKAASAEPLLAGWFAEALAEIDPEIAACIAVLWWRGGEEGPERAVLAQADAVLAYGSDATLAEIRARVPVSARFLSFGHKISFAMVGRAALDARRAAAAARACARDVARYDQQGCYSPQAVVVERGGAVSPRDFALYLAGALARLERRFPRRALSVSEEAATARWVQSQAVRAAAGGETQVIRDGDGRWSVVYDEDTPMLMPAGANRTVRVMPVDRLEGIVPALAAARAALQTVGIAAAPEELFRLAEILGAAGVNRLCALGRMTAPEAGWHHDGRPSLLDLVSFVDIDRSAEDAADGLAPHAP